MGPSDHREGRFLLGRDSCPGGCSPGRLWKREQDRMVVPGSSPPQPLGTHDRFLFLVLGQTHRRLSPLTSLCSDFPSSGQAPAQPKSWATLTEGPGHDRGTGTLKRHSPLWRARGHLGLVSCQHRGTPSPATLPPSRPQGGGAGIQTVERSASSGRVQEPAVTQAPSSIPSPHPRAFRDGA